MDVKVKLNKVQAKPKPKNSDVITYDELNTGDYFFWSNVVGKLGKDLIFKTDTGHMWVGDSHIMTGDRVNAYRLAVRVDVELVANWSRPVV